MKTVHSEEESPLPDACQPDTVQPLDIVFKAPLEDLTTRAAPLSNLLGPDPLAQVSPKEPSDTAVNVSESGATTPPTYTSRPIGKATKGESIASDTVKLTEAIKSALGGAKITGDQEQGLERNSLPSGTSPPGHTWTSEQDSALSPATSDSNVKTAGSPSALDDDENLEKKALGLLKKLQELGYTIQKDPTHAAPKPLNLGSAASLKSDNIQTCPKCRNFKGRPCEVKYGYTNLF